MPYIAEGKGVGDLGGVSCTRIGKWIHVFNMIPRNMLAGAGATHRSHLYPLAHESLQDAFSLR